MTSSSSREPIRPVVRTRHASLSDDAFVPPAPRSIKELGVSETLIESICFQILINVGSMSGRKIAERMGIPFPILEKELAQYRARQLVTHIRPAAFGDFFYSLSEAGQKRTLQLQKSFTYTGPLPVPLSDYLLSVEAQATNFDPIDRQKLSVALQHITYDPAWLDFLGPAINSNAGIFLWGPPGNGKTTLARCLTACRGNEIWVPHAIIDDGCIVKVFDAAYHVASKPVGSEPDSVGEVDLRWIRIRRPTVVVGGELTMDNLEIRHDPRYNLCEAPLQMKSNCGCLLIDDFGRQRIAPAELLNRWIIPLENRIDFLTLPNGKKIQVPFEQSILFSTNLQPEALVDEAFMRRVPFKIEIGDPSTAEFLTLLQRSCQSFGIVWRSDVAEQFVDRFYRMVGRSLRRCHARDLLYQVRCICLYRNEKPELRMDLLEQACRNYFGNSPGLSRLSYRPGMVAVSGNSVPVVGTAGHDGFRFGQEQLESQIEHTIQIAANAALVAGDSMGQPAAIPNLSAN